MDKYIEKFRVKRYENIILNIDEVVTHLRLPKDGLYCRVLNLRKRLRNIEEETVAGLIDCMGIGTMDVGFTARIYDLAEQKINNVPRETI